MGHPKDLAFFVSISTMGKKIVGLYCTLCVLSFCLISISCFNKWHQVTFKTLGIRTVFRLETTLTKAILPEKSKLWCNFFKQRRHGYSPKRCGDLQEGMALQEAAADWCAPLIQSLYPAPCIAFNRAYVIGLCVLMTYGLNLILLCSSGYLLYYYLDSKSHKPIYRTWATILHGIATFLMIGAVASYSCFAVPALDAMGGGGIPGFLEASHSVGISPGYFLVWTGILCQLIAFCMHACMKLSNEETDEQRIYKDMLKEQETYGAMEEQAASFQAAQADASGYGYDAQAGYAGGYDASAMGYPAGYDASAAGYTGYGAAAYPAGSPAVMPSPQAAGMPPAQPGGAAPQPGQAAW